MGRWRARDRRATLFCAKRRAASGNRFGHAVADWALKSLGMDHGNPSLEHGVVWFCSGATTFGPEQPVKVGTG